MARSKREIRGRGRLSEQDDADPADPDFVPSSASSTAPPTPAKSIGYRPPRQRSALGKSTAKEKATGGVTAAVKKAKTTVNKKKKGKKASSGSVKSDLCEGDYADEQGMRRHRRRKHAKELGLEQKSHQCNSCDKSLYLAVGLLMKGLKAIYTGRDGHIASRLMGHLGELQATGEGFAPGTFLYDVLVDCERVMWFKLWDSPSNLDAEEAGDITAILEGIFTMLLGSFDRDGYCHKLRLSYGLEDLGSNVVGCNAIPCVENPTKARQQTVMNVEYQCAFHRVRHCQRKYWSAQEGDDEAKKAHAEKVLRLAIRNWAAVLRRLLKDGELLFQPSPLKGKEGKYPKAWLGLRLPKNLCDWAPAEIWRLRLVQATNPASSNHSYRRRPPLSLTSH